MLALAAGMREPAGQRRRWAGSRLDRPITPAAAEGTRMSNGLNIEDLKVGNGAEATSGKRVEVHYTGWLTNGQKFDSSVDRGKPFGFQLGAGQVIKGWDQGVAGMKVGGKRKLTIPPDLGYGARGAGGVIPPNATLVFEVELLAVK
jgi:FKBP-type peptidyl-prolyl cis-trans isomerase FkpA